MTASLRKRLLSGIVLGVFALLVVFSLLLYVIMRHKLISQFDGSLLTTAKMLSAVVEREDPRDIVDNNDGQNSIYQDSQERLEFDFDLGMTPEFMKIQGGSYFQIRLDDGTIILRSPSLESNDLPDKETELASPAVQKTVFPDGRPGRIIHYQFIPDSQGDDDGSDRILSLAVAKGCTELYSFLGFIRWLLLNCVVVVVTLSALVGLKVIKTGLRPVHVLAAEIDTVDERSLDQSFSHETYPQELKPICNQLNRFLSRIHISFERGRQFSTNIAHELCTPLAGIQSTIEVCLTHRRPPLEYVEALQISLGITKSMQKLVDTLLTLSQLNTGEKAPRIQSLDLKSLIDECWRVVADKAFDQQIVFKNQVQEPCMCTSNAEYLAIILNNVLENAVAYTDSGGCIQITTEQTEDVISLCVSNTGCRLGADEVSHVFDSFWRGDKARSDTGSHCGIGLTLVRSIAAVLSIPIKVSLEEPDTFAFHLELTK